MLQIYNNLTRRKEAFQPIDPGNVRLYVCGMTVYDYCHLGHGRVLVVFDVVYRYLRRLYGERQVTYVRNITDIDDKIINRANENGEAIDHLTGRFIEAMHEDAAALGVLRPDQEPRATRHMDSILHMIQSLVDKGYAYAADNGDVYYQVSRFVGYGALSGKNTEDLRAGARVEVDTNKRDPLDFVLWKSAKPGEPYWESPWGNGRPGWHIECSAMSTHCLGNHFDIHGGGLDLQFPHHENEIAQSEAATGEKFVNVWMHNGFVRVDDEKMSKSLGNFFTIREILKKYDPEVVRFFILNSHYRSPLNYSDQHLDAAKASRATLYNALHDLPQGQAPKDTDYERRFLAAMDDDFNTPEAIAVLFEMAGEINRIRKADMARAANLGTLMVSLGEMLGLLQLDSDDVRKGRTYKFHGSTTVPFTPNAYSRHELGDKHINELIQQRNEARKNKNWAESDRIRDALAKQGIILEDGPTGTTWRRE